MGPFVAEFTTATGGLWICYRGWPLNRSPVRNAVFGVRKHYIETSIFVRDCFCHVSCRHSPVALGSLGKHAVDEELVFTPGRFWNNDRG